MYRKILLLLMLTLIPLYAQIGVKQSYQLGTERSVPAASDYAFLGNGIVDIVIDNSQQQTWAATGYGLNMSSDEGQTWQVFQPDDYLTQGGVSAIGFMDDSTLWVAAAYDTSVQDEDLPIGGGLSYTRNGGATWTHVSQPMDSKDETQYSPTTTRVQNLTYDIAFVDSTIWIACFGGGLRRSDDMGKTWEVVTTDGIAFSSLNYLNHRAFSLLSENGNLWYGSAEGISKSSNDGKTWQRFTHKNQESPISGNFVVALDYQEATHAIWAATIEANDSSEVRAVSKSSNGGITWDVMLQGKFAHYFAFDGKTVYVATDEGIFVSNDEGNNWYKAPSIIDAQNGEEILSDEYYSVAVQNFPAYSRLWFGSSDGLATTTDNGNSWKVIRSFVSTRKRTSPKVYAYPSPFSPSRNGYARFQYDISGPADVEIKIYNFAMEHVTTIRETENNYTESSSDRSAKWDGTDSDGKTVASGVYFFRADVGGKVSWGKVIVIN